MVIFARRRISGHSVSTVWSNQFSGQPQIRGKIRRAFMSVAGMTLLSVTWCSNGNAQPVAPTCRTPQVEAALINLFRRVGNDERLIAATEEKIRTSIYPGRFGYEEDLQSLREDRTRHLNQWENLNRLPPCPPEPARLYQVTPRRDYKRTETLPGEPAARKLRTTDIEPVRLNQVIPRRDYQRVEESERQQIASWTGLYVGGEVAGNFNRLRQIESFAATGVVTNRFSDSSSAFGGGLNAGYLIAPWNNHILIGSFASVDFLNQDTNHSFPGEFFLGQTINVIGTVGAQASVVGRVGLAYGKVGFALANLDQKLNFSGRVTSENRTVPGVTFGIGAAFQPANWQIAGSPVSAFIEWDHTFLQDARFNNAGSPGFNYRNVNDIDTVKVGTRLHFSPMVLKGYVDADYSPGRSR
jgi:hypothetical protein